jgi:hypothetical protein
MKLINSITKQEIKISDTVISFRGEKFEVMNWSEPQHAGSSGRMYVKVLPNYQPPDFSPIKGDYSARELFPSVFNCEFI